MLLVLNHLDSIGNGSWSTDGLQTEQVISEESATTVQCTSTHLTSFAVLVSTGGVRQVCINSGTLTKSIMTTLYFMILHYRVLL